MMEASTKCILYRNLKNKFELAQTATKCLEKYCEIEVL